MNFWTGETWINYLNNHEAAEQVKQEIEQKGGYAELLPFDASQPQQIEAAIDQWESAPADEWISILVNYAGSRGVLCPAPEPLL